MTLNSAQVFDALHRQTITKVVVHFSGGNDEGGADGYTAHYADGTEKPLADTGAYLDHQTQRHVVSEGYVDGQHKTRPATTDEIDHAQLMEALEQPIYDRWGGFSGDFHVDGTLTWDAVARKATFDGQESGYQSFGYEV